VIVIGYAPVGVLVAEVNIVSTSWTPDCESVIGFCAQLAEAPEGSPETDMVTVCGAPETVAVVWMEFPCETLPDVGFSERNTPGMMISVNVEDWMACPLELVPVTTIEYVPGAALFETVTVIMEVAGEFGAMETGLGLNDTVTPCGTLEVESVTEPE
jgi:hypothetical protein